ncbi:MAG: class I SAM-dependent methyltransferase [Chloroflexota bacterium]
MPHLRSRHYASVTVVVVALAASIVLLALGLDALSLVLGGAVVAAAFATVIGFWLEPAARARRAGQRRERKAKRLARKRTARMRKVIHAAERRLFSQLEALAWLRDELDLKRPLPATRGAAAAPDALLQLVRLVDRGEPRSVVELGSGVSTIVIAARLKAAGKGRLVALEHEPTYARATRAELRAQGLDGIATVVDAPLVEVSVGDETWQWYEIGAEMPERIDLLFVDGPPGRTGPLARYPALPLLRDRLVPGATILVDDGDRADEQVMVQRWESEIEGLAARHLAFAKGAWLVTMPG